jgi:triosephosphate isomerase
MPRTPFIAGNWKMNTTKASAIELAKAVAKKPETREKRMQSILAMMAKGEKFHP